MPGFNPGGLATASTTFTEGDRLAQAEGVVRDFCRWHIAPVMDTDVDVNGSGYVTHVLRTRLLVSVSDVTLDDVPLTVDVHYRFDSTGILRRIDGGTFTGRLKLTMSHGYETPPAPIQAVIADMAKSGAAGGVVGAASMQAGPFGVTFGSNSQVAQAGGVGMSFEQRSVLSRYALEPGLF